MTATDILETEPKAEQGVDTLGRRNRQLRKLRERTLDSLAQEIGLTKGYLSKVETGRQTPPLGTLSKLAKALGTDLAGLVENEGAGQPEPGYSGVSVVRADARRDVIRLRLSVAGAERCRQAHVAVSVHVPLADPQGSVLRAWWRGDDLRTQRRC